MNALSFNNKSHCLPCSSSVSLCFTFFSTKLTYFFFPLPLFPHTLQTWANSQQVFIKSMTQWIWSPSIFIRLWFLSFLLEVRIFSVLYFTPFCFCCFGSSSFQHLPFCMSFTSWTNKNKWEELLLMKCLPNYYSIILLPLQSNFMNCLSILSSFFSPHLLFPTHYHLASVPVNPMGHFPILIELVSPVAFNTVRHLLFTLALRPNVFLLVFCLVSFVNFALLPIFMPSNIGALKYSCPSWTQLKLCPGSFSYSPGFCDLVLWELPRPTWRIKESSVYYLHPDALQHFSLKRLKAYVISSRTWFLFLVSQCQWMTLSSFQLPIQTGNISYQYHP